MFYILIKNHIPREDVKTTKMWENVSNWKTLKNEMIERLLVCCIFFYNSASWVEWGCQKVIDAIKKNCSDFSLDRDLLCHK
jgi:hypothetical protein